MAAKRNYVNNKDLFAALQEYLHSCDVADAAEETIPVVPKYIGECIYEIATRLSSKSNFSGYTYRDDMVMDGIENCLTYIRNFNPEKSNNPFAYFTSIIWYAFIRRINKEKRQMYIRYKTSSALIGSGDIYFTGEHDESSPHINPAADHVNAFIKDYEEKMMAKKMKGKKVAENK